ncbi:unnamed protein product, partial [Brassica oleracea]
LKTKSHNPSLLQAAPICSDGRPSGAWSSEAYSSPLPLCCLLRFAVSLSSVEILSALGFEVPSPVVYGCTLFLPVAALPLSCRLHFASRGLLWLVVEVISSASGFYSSLQGGVYLEAQSSLVQVLCTRARIIRRVQIGSVGSFR